MALNLLTLRRCLPGRAVLLSLIGWLLLIVGVWMLIGAGIALTWPHEFRSTSPVDAAAFIALAGLLLTVSQQVADKAEARSQFYLEEYRKGYDIAYATLASTKRADPLLRLKWLAAARVLESARRLAEQVTVRAHREVIDMDIPNQSQRFQPFLELPSTYYYGVDLSPMGGLSEEESLHDAARRSTAPHLGTLNAHREVPENAIQTVWKAIQYPDNYSDVLGEPFSERDSLFLPRGLRDYVTHARTYHSVMGKLYRGDREIPEPKQNIFGDKA